MSNPSGLTNAMLCVMVAVVHYQTVLVYDAGVPQILVQMSVDPTTTPFHPMWDSDIKPALLHIKGQLRNPNCTREVKKDLVACVLFFIWWSTVAPDAQVTDWVTKNLKNATDEFRVFDKCRALVWPSLILIGPPRIGKSACITLRCIMAILLGEWIGVLAGEHSDMVKDMAQSMEAYKKCFKPILDTLGVAFLVKTDNMLTTADIHVFKESHALQTPWIFIFKYHLDSVAKFKELYEAGVITHVCMDEAHTPIIDYESHAADEDVKRAKFVKAVLQGTRTIPTNGSIMLASGTPNVILQTGTLRWYVSDTKTVVFEMAAKYGPEYINLRAPADVDYVGYDETNATKKDMLFTSEMERHYRHMFDTAFAYGVSWLSTRQQQSAVTAAVEPLYKLASSSEKQLHVFTLGHAGVTHYTPSGGVMKLKDKTKGQKQSAYVTSR